MRTTSKPLVRRRHLRSSFTAAAKPSADKAALTRPSLVLTRAALTAGFMVGLGAAMFALLRDVNVSSIPTQILSLWARPSGVSCAPVAVGELAASQAHLLEDMLSMASGPLVHMLGLASLLMGVGFSVVKRSLGPAVVSVVIARMLKGMPFALASVMGCIGS